MTLDLEDRLVDAFDRIAARTIVDPLPPFETRHRSSRRQMLLRAAVVCVLAGGAVAGLTVARVEQPGDTGDSVADESVPPVPALFDGPAATIEWAVVEPDSTIAEAQIGSMVAGPGGFVAAGMGFENMDDGQGRVWFSPDGETWEPVAYDLFREQGVEVTATTEAYYAVATPEQDEGDPARPGQLYRSFDGRTWEAVGGARLGFGSVAVAGDVLIRSAPGSDGVTVSDDGESWEPASFDGAAVDGLPWPPRFAELGGTSYTSTVDVDLGAQPFWASSDGRAWTSIPAPSAPGFPVAASSGLASLVVTNGEECTAPAGAEPDEALEIQRACRLLLRVEQWTPGDEDWTPIGQLVVPTAVFPRTWVFGNQLVAAIERPDGGLSVWMSADGAMWSNPLNAEPQPEASQLGAPTPYWVAAQNDTTIVIPISSTGAGGDPGRLVVGHIVDG